MSFASRTKKELTQVASTPCCEQSELIALIQHAGALHEWDNGKVLDLSTENAAIARRAYTLWKSVYAGSLEVLVQKKMRLKKNNVYIIRMRWDVEPFLHSLGLYDGEQLVHRMPEGFITQTCCKKSYMRGAFLASGSVNDPESHTYHLEISNKNTQQVDHLLKLLQGFRLHAKEIERKKGHIIYLKEGEKIVEFLGLIGAHQAVLHFEEVRIVKGMRNQVNRLVNCETANLNKTISAAVRQMENIRLIEARVGLNKLPRKLQVVAEKRLQYPEITLQELCEVLPERVSKSGLNHRLRKLDEIAKKIRADRQNYLES
jgi:DNA-binding protein WhiA